VIDLHSHVLPGVDDGAPDVEAAVALATAAAAAGVTVLAATPHLRADHPRVVASELAGRMQALRDALGQVPIELVGGAEVDIAHALEADADELRLASYGQRGADVLVETPYGVLPPSFEDLLFRIEAHGYRVLLAHPERNRDFQRRPRRLAELVRRGTLVQVTAASLAEGRRGSSTRRFAHALVAEGVAHVIASDDHGGGWRASLAEGVAAAASTAPERARWMVTEAPAAILAGEPLPSAPADRRGGLLRRRRGS
jgi:protein-tyrosine phosphatase